MGCVKSWIPDGTLDQLREWLGAPSDDCFEKLRMRNGVIEGLDVHFYEAKPWSREFLTHEVVNNLVGKSSRNPLWKREVQRLPHRLKRKAVAHCWDRYLPRQLPGSL